MNRMYGFTKFIIVVPSVAIKEGVYKSLQMTEEHFRGLYDNVQLDYFVYDSQKLGQVRNFATSDYVQIMVINIDAFRKSFTDPEKEDKANIIHRPHDRMTGSRPIEFIQATNPIVIIDDPQSVDTTEKSKEAIASLNPLCTLRYSATHVDKHHMMYKLDSVDAYERKLVKQIEVAGIEVRDSHNKAYIKLLKVDNRKSPITARRKPAIAIITPGVGITVCSQTQTVSMGLEKIRSRQTRVRYPPKGYYGHWVIEYTLPYIRSSSSQGDIELGALQIIFSAQGIASYSRRLRMEYLFYIAIIAAVFTLFIIPLTGYLIVRRLERLMETIAAVQAGDVTARARDSSKDEIGRLSRSFNSMIEQISSEHASRLQALGNLAAGVAHEVKNPLNSIAMTIQYLKDTIDSDPDGEAQECLDVMTQQVAELDRIVEDFLQLTRPVQMDLRPSDLNAFLADMMRSFATSLEVAGVKLITDYSREALYVRIDRDKMRQAISNVVINAIQAMPDGGQLRIKTDRDALHKAAIIEVSDTGGGISQENLDRIFEPYFTTKSDGTGLGLTITYRLVEAHGGDVRVESSEGQGAVFTIFLPQS